MPDERPVLDHRSDSHLGWHRPVSTNEMSKWLDRPVLDLRAGVVRGVSRVTAVIYLPTQGDYPHPHQFITARWKGGEETPYTLVRAASLGLQRWLEGYTQ